MGPCGPLLWVWWPNSATFLMQRTSYPVTPVPKPLVWNVALSVPTHPLRPLSFQTRGFPTCHRHQKLQPQEIQRERDGAVWGGRGGRSWYELWHSAQGPPRGAHMEPADHVPALATVLVFRRACRTVAWAQALSQCGL